MVSKGIIGLLLCGLAGLGLLVGGCGSSSDETTSLTHAQFVRAGNAICEKQLEKREKAIGEAIAKVKPGKVMSDSEKKKAILRITPFYEEQIAKLKALGAPEGDTKKIEAIVQAMEEAAKQTRANVNEAINTTRMYFKANQLATGYGLEHCAV